MNPNSSYIFDFPALNSLFLNPKPRPSEPAALYSQDTGLQALRPEISTPAEKYKIDEIPKIREQIYNKVKQAVLEHVKFEDDNYKFVLEDVRYEGPEEVLPEQERRFVLSGYSLIRPLRATIKLIDKKENKVISSARKRIAAVPYLTNRGTFILNGVEYGMVNQTRLRPGVYTRVSNDGMYEAMVNIQGKGHRYVLDPESGVFSFTSGQANIPLLSLLRAIDIPDDQIRQAWGEEIYRINKAKTSSRDLTRIYESIFGKSPKANENVKESIKNYILNLKFDPVVNRITLKQDATQMTPELLLFITKKLLEASRGAADIDDRNHIGFLRVYGPEEIISEAIKFNLYKLNARFFAARAKRDVSAIPAGFFDHYIEAAIYGSGLGNALQQINPLEMLDNRYRVTRLGTGGISSKNLAGESLKELRHVHPSHLGFIDPLLTPEGENVGLDNRLAYGLLRDSNGNFYNKFKDVKSGKEVYLTPVDLFNKVVTFPGELEANRGFVRALFNNQHVLVKPRQVDYVLAAPDNMYSPLTNLIPMKQNSYAQRVSMGGRMIAQAVGLVDPESPLVRNAAPDGRSYDEIFGEYYRGSRAPVSGIVTKVARDHIEIQDSKNKKYNVYFYVDFPYNRKTFYTEYPVVKEGDRVDAGAFITKSNYVDSQGALALGRNLKTVYMAYEGLNFEDAAVLSESGAKKLASVHAYQKWIDKLPSMLFGLRKFQSIFPGLYKKEFYSKYDEDGVIKKGAIVKKDEPLVLAAKETRTGLRRLFVDASEYWDHEDDGEVIDVIKGDKFINVLVRSVHPFRVGDKIAGRYGDKHIIGAILPDSQMPKDSSGEPFELILNPLGVQGRVNLSQIWEALLGKVAKKVGEPIVLRDHSGNMVDFVSSLLKEHGIEDKEDVLIDKYKDKIKAVTGYRYMMKLHHMAESKLSGRATGGYTSEGAPVKGGFEGAKRIGLLEMMGILAHGAYNVARDARVIRGQANREFWAKIAAGYEIPQEPSIPFIYTKFQKMLIGAGLYPFREGSQERIFALTNSAIKELSKGRALRNGGAVSIKEGKLIPVPGGLFDSDIFGGFNGNLWGEIRLPEPIPNPLLEAPLARLFGLSKKDFRAVLFGEKRLGKYGSGAKAFIDAFEAISYPKLLSYYERRLEGAPPSQRDSILRNIKFLRALKDSKIPFKDLFWEAVPVLPPAFRPVGFLVGSEVPVSADINFLYKTLHEVSLAARELKEAGLLDSKDRARVYEAVNAVIGLADPLDPKHRQQGLKGLIPSIIGASPKVGLVQRKLLGAAVDLVGRGTIIPNPNLSIDEVGIPEAAAWQIYRPFVIRRLVKGGYAAADAIKEVLSKSARAKAALLAEMGSRPVIISRAPVLHKFGVLAAWPRLIPGSVMELPPFLVGGFGADFDGDAMQFHVPVAPEAVKEAIERLLPSRNLFSLQDFSAIIKPSMEYTGGLYYLSRLKPDPRLPRASVSSREELIEKLRSGEIKPNQLVTYSPPPSPSSGASFDSSRRLI